MHARWRSLFAPLVIAAAILPLVVGCSSSDDGSTTSTTVRSTTTTSTTTPTPPTTPSVVTLPPVVDPLASPDCPAASALNSLLADPSQPTRGTVEDPIGCDGPWAFPTLVLNDEGVGIAGFQFVEGRWTLFYAGASLRGLCDTARQVGYTGDLGCPDESAGTQPASSGSSCDDGTVDSTVAQILAAAQGRDASATADPVSFCDGRWAVFMLGSDTFAYPVLLQAEGGSWVERPRESPYCESVPAEIAYVCQVS